MPKSDLNYDKLGVTPPSVEEHGTEEDIAAQLGKKQIHNWRQEGARLYCIACPFGHSTEPRFVNQLLQGTDKNGLPILRQL